MDVYASRLRREVEAAVAAVMEQVPPEARATAEVEVEPEAAVGEGTERVQSGPDVMSALLARAIEQVRQNQEILDQAASEEGVPWMKIQRFIASTLPPEVVGTLVPDPDEWAFQHMIEALNAVFGQNGWRKEKVPSRADPTRLVTYVWRVSP